MSGKRTDEHNRFVNNCANLLISDEKYQKVKVGDQYYLAKRVPGEIRSRNTGAILEEKYIALLIGKFVNEKVIPLDSGDIAKKSYFIDSSIFSTGVENEDILEELKEKDYDVSLITSVPPMYHINDIEN